MLEADGTRREDNTIIAKELLPIFESLPTAWRAGRYLHMGPRSVGTPADFMSGWREVCPLEDRAAVDSIAAVLARGPAA